MDIFTADKKYIANTYSRFPVHITGGKGSLIYGSDGKEYIDLGTGIAVNTFGIADDEWIAAVTEQLGAVQHTSNLYYSTPDVLLAEQLCSRTGMSRVFFSNSGAEANECAIKAARKYSADKYGVQRHVIITLENSFHGRTITTLAATGQDVFHHDFLPLTEGFIQVKAGDMDAVRSFASDDTVAAIMFECVQGEGGVMPLDRDFVSELAAFAHENDVLLIADEVQCGNGRTGKLYGYMSYGITPDIVSTAKGLAGGLPLGATLLGEKVAEVFTSGTHGSTFGGNPVCCAAALNILSRIDEAMLTEVRRKSEYIIGSLSGAEGIESVTGMGLMLGIQTKVDASKVIAMCMERGVMPIKAKNKVRLLPALNIPDDLLKKALEVIKAVCTEASRQG